MSSRPHRRHRLQLREVVLRGNRGPIDWIDKTANRNRQMWWQSKREERHRRYQVIECRDGFRLSVLAGPMTHCWPQPDWTSAAGAPWVRRLITDGVAENYPGPYTHVEVGMWHPNRPTDATDAWDTYGGDSGGGDLAVYSRVPVRLVEELIRHHGGERAWRVRHAHARRLRSAHLRSARRRARRGARSASQRERTSTGGQNDRERRKGVNPHGGR